MVSFRAAEGIEKEKARNRAMGPGQSMAMAGNTGLAGLSERQVNDIQKGIQTINQATKGDKGSSYQAIGQNINEVGSKYQRPSDVQAYADKMDIFNQGIMGGGNIVEGPDGILRLQFGKDNIVRNALGQQMLSMMLPQLNATAPTLSQLGGDIKRAFTGYNSLQYTDPTSNTPEMVYTPGMGEGLTSLFMPGGMLMKGVDIIKELFGLNKPTIVRGGGSVISSVTEEPMNSGVIDVLP